MTWIEDAYGELAAWVPQRVPDIVLAIAVIIVGYLVARLARWLAARLLRRWSLGLVSVVERVSRRRGLAAEINRDEAENVAVGVAARIVFWLVFALFLATATATIGIPVLSTWLEGFASYLPRVLAAAAVVLLGLLGGHLARVVVLSGATSARLPYARALARMVQTSVVVIAGVLAIEELGVATTLLIALACTALAAVLGGCALAFGLGARRAVGNLVACHYLSRIYHVGHRVRVGVHEGVIVEIVPHAVILQTPEGRALIPAHVFADEASVLLSPDPT